MSEKKGNASQKYYDWAAVRSVATKGYLRVLIFAVAALLLFSRLYGLHSGAAIMSATPEDPVPYFYLTWTATGTGSSDAVDSNGKRTVIERRIAFTGSAVIQQYADGSQRAFPLQSTFTDDYDETTDTSPPCPDHTHTLSHITDPNRYGPDPGLKISDLQRPDGSWYIEDPFIEFEINLFFNYRHDTEYRRCNGDSGTDSFSLPSSPIILGVPSATGDVTSTGKIEGDAQGKVFKIDMQRQSTLVTPGYALTIHWTVTARRLTGRDLTVDQLEVTQGLQNLANSIPLVQNRRTVVRAYLSVGKDQVPIPGVTGKLTGYSGDTPLGTVSPFNPGGRITAPAWPDWKQIDHTLNFELPLAWTEQPSLRLEVEVNDDHNVTEIDYTNNKLSVSVKTIPCWGVVIGFLPVHYLPPGGYTPTDPSNNIVVGQEFMRKIYPIPEKKLKYIPLPALTWTKSISTSNGDTELLLELMRRHLEDGGPDLYGWTPSLASPDNGLGFLLGNEAFGNDTESPNRWRRTFAHEIGHTYGLNHNDLDTNGRHWFDVYERKIKPGNELLDVMVPEKLEPEAWVSATTYLYLMDMICYTDPQPLQSSQPSVTSNDNLIVTGTLSNPTNATTGTIDPLYRTTMAPTNIPRTGSPYCVNLKSATNSVLGQYCFSVDFEDDSSTPSSAMPFGMAVPYPAGLSRVELTRGTTVLNARVASANPPTVKVTYPNASGLSLGGAQTITWTGSDPDGDQLTYSILYSRDNGATWIAVGSDITGGSYALDFSTMPGGTSALVKVMVSDGFRSAEDISDNAFSVANKPPTAAITSPPSGASFNANTAVTLQGVGLDLEGGSLGDSALSWTSDRDGPLGTGQLLEKLLSPGTHTIALTARDSDGLTSIATITCNVVSTQSATPSPTPTAIPTPTATPSATPTPTLGIVQFSASSYSVLEDCTALTITVNRVGDASAAASVDYFTSDVTASERRDYITAIGTLHFAPSETLKSFAVLINEDSYVEGPETFNVNLRNPSGLGLGALSIATVTINDDATEPTINAIDEPRTYVCQHYHDFLNRQPDQGGWDFWTNEIGSCGTNQACIELKRINVSAAYFLSIEFQQTGYLVERMYKAAYGDATGTSTFGGTHQLPVPFVLFNEFLPDVQNIGQGVVVGQAGWEALLENNKQAFATEFVHRAQFYSAFPTSMTPAQFVDKLNTNAGNVLSTVDRTTAIGLFGGATDISNATVCAQVLRQVAENPTLLATEFNRAFVLMQFYGYLRRNPNEPPDADYSGYDFWLTKLNQFNGNYINAEMVRAFITSAEYRQRFGL